MQLHVRHVTRYTYTGPVVHGLNRLRIKPKSTHGQQVRVWDMVLDGAVLETEYEDEHHNSVALVSVEPGIRQLEIACTGTIETSDNAGVIGHHAGHMPLWCFLRPTPLTMPGPTIRALASRFDRTSEDRVALLHDLSTAVHGAISYETGRTHVQTSGEEALVAAHGVCQDHTHVFLSACRLLDIPARYVSGYLMMNDRIEQDAGHAWAEAHVSGLGWVGFDISNAISPDERYVRVATGCDYAEAAPVTGVLSGSNEATLHVELAVAQQQIQQ